MRQLSMSSLSENDLHDCKTYGDIETLRKTTSALQYMTGITTDARHARLYDNAVEG
jgi:hypothetical protein